ncbi:multicopper oxidase family protein [Bradyrhizobium prioriisuperbiae]|uniref:multicopper oxidase family protein n=1 Tax=Bradyrhizobium prioriisuperbiae TaxID=2854389 RepID=UPI0028ED616C|nr:multicopper oxidase domain-containing protein [Bradyrhizobium prioritasuperba]
MKKHPLLPSRRLVLTGLGGAATAVLAPRTAALGQNPASAGRPSLDLRLRPSTAGLRDNQPPSAIWDFVSASGALPTAQEFRQGDDLQLALANDLPAPVTLSLRGLVGVAQIEPLAARPPLLTGQSSSISVPLRLAGTLLCDARLLGDGQALALPARAIRVMEKQPVAVDADQTLLIEDWRLKPDGSAVAPGSDPGGASPLFTVNSKPSLDIPVWTNARLRLRFINACQRSVIALKIDDHELRVMAIDSQPAEPFVARNGQVILAPGTRVDAFVDTTGKPSTTAAVQLHDGTSPRPIARLVYVSEGPLRAAPLAAPDPLPSNGLPAKLDLKSALRVDLPVDIKPTPSAPEWLLPTNLGASVAPAFRIKRGRVAVLALANRAATPAVVHLHGHPFRLLDRLDDGWKPFWLDTLILEAGQTQRIAFAAEYSGSWLIEAMGTDWSAPRLTRWYVVD